MQSSIANWGIGINLGTTLDARGGETAGNNPVTTRPMIHLFAQSGFDILRIPTTWHLHIGPEPDYAVDPAWMDRVEEVVRWGLDEGMRVILNTHHEQSSWLKTELKHLPQVLPKFVALWKQIAARFRDYDDRLVFQGLNEPRVEGGQDEWNGGTPDVRAAVNALNAAFVETVRQSGGNNQRRWLCIPPVGAKICTEGLEGLIVPKDDRVIISVHTYMPESFCLSHTRPGSTPYFTPEVEKVMNDTLDILAAYVAHAPAPIILTEHGAVTKPIDDQGNRNDQDRAAFERAFLRRAKAMGIPCVLWENNYYDDGDEWFGLFDRSALKCNTPVVLAAMMEEK